MGAVSATTTTSLFLLACLLGTASARATSVQACGNELVDLVTVICMKRGGFHAPLVRRSAPPLLKREAAAYHLLNEFRRSSYPSLSELRSGRIVDECCRKDCTLTHLESYCAEPQLQQDQPDFEPVVSLPEAQVQIEHHKQQQQQTVVTSESTQELSETGGRLEPVMSSSPRRPNVGTYSRTRPYYFVVSSPLHQDVEDLFSDMLN